MVSDPNICEGGVVTLTATVSGGTGTTNFQWQINNSGTWEDVSGATAAIFSTGALSPGTYEYQVVVSQDAGCEVISVPETITVVADPVVTVSANDQSICAGGVVTLSAGVTGGSGTTSYQWQLFTAGPGWQDIVGATSSDYTTDPLAVGDHDFRVLISQNEGCDVTSATITITAVPGPVVSITVDDNQICAGGQINFTSSVTGGSGTTLYQWQFNDPVDGWENVAGETNSTFSTVLVNSGTFEFRLSVTQDAGCEQFSNSIIITVVEDPTVNVTVVDDEICEGGLAELSVSVSGGAGATSYQWQFEDPVDGWEDISGATSASYSETLINAGTYNYRVQISQDAGCDITSVETAIVVVPDPTVAVTLADDVICEGGQALFNAIVTGGTGTTTYQWQINNSGTWEDITEAFNPTYATTALPVGTHEIRVVITQDSGCEVISETLTVTIVDDPTVDLTVSDPSICEGGSVTISAVVSDGTGPTSYQWQIFNGSVWDDLPGATSDTYITPALAIGTHDYRVVVSQDAGCLVIGTATSIVVVADPVVTVSADDEQFCEGGTATLSSTVTGGAGTTAYQWQINNGGSWQDIPGATADTYTTPALNAGTYQYRLDVSQDEGCDVISDVIDLVVVADPTVSVSADDATICAGGTATLTATVGSGAGTTFYQWQYNNSGTWENISGATASVYTTPVLATGFHDYRVEITQDAGCNVVSSDVTIEVVDDPTVTISADDTDICDGGFVTLTATVSGGAGTTLYQWQEETSPGVWNDIPGATSSTYQTPTLTPDDYTFRVDITQDAGCAVTSSELTVTVVPDPTVSVSADDNTICAGGTATLSATVSGGNGTTEYQWQINNSGTWNDIPGETSSDFTTPVLTTGTYQYRVEITQDAGCAVTSGATTISVVADPTVGVAVDDDQICEDGVATFTATVSGGNGTTNYQWEYNNPVSGWETLAGETSDTYTTGPLPIGTHEYRVQIVQDAGCAVESAPISVVVVADPTVSVSADDQEICDGGTVTISSIVSGGAGSSNYQWQEETSPGNWSNIGGATASSYTTPVLTTGDYNYRLVVTQDAGCSVTSTEVAVSVLPDPTVTLSADFTTVCSNGSVTLTATVLGGAGTSMYQWQFFNGSTWVDIAGATAFEYTTSSLAEGTYDYRVEITQDAGCAVTSSPITITVVPDPTVTVSADDEQICEGGSAEISATVSGGAGGATYQWQQFTAGPGWEDIPGATSLNYTTPPLSFGTSSYRVIVTQVSGCAVASATVNIVVVADPTVTASVNLTDLCDGGVVDLSSTVSGGTGTTNYQWQQNIPGTGWEDISGATTANYTTTTLAVGSYQFRLLITQDAGCDATSNVLDVTVSPDPVVSVTVPDVELCTGGSTTLSASTTGGSGSINYQWQLDNSGTWEDIPGATSSDYNTGALLTGTYDYRVIASQVSGCADTSSATTITVYDDPVVNVTVDVSQICNGGTATFTAGVTGGSGTTGYQWQFNLPGTGWVDVAGATGISYTTSTLSPGNYEYRVQVTQDPGCEVISASESVEVIPDPTVSVTTGEASYCEGGTTTLTADVTGGSGTTTYQWQINNSGTWEDLSGATLNTYSTPTSLVPGVYEYRVEISQNPGCEVVSSASSVTVVADPVVTIAADDDSFCDGGATDIMATVTGGTGATLYQWEYDGVSGWEDISGATSDVYNTGALPIGTHSFRVRITQANGCDALSASTDIVVSAGPTVSITADDTEICSGGTATLNSTVSGGSGNTSYQWQINNSGTWTDIPGATASVYGTATLTTGTYEYRLTVQQDAGCVAISNPLTITVVADPVVTVSADDLTICNGGSSTLTATVTGGTGTTQYQWQEYSGGAWGDITGATAIAYTTPNLTTGTYQYRLIVTQDAGCSTISATSTITVVDDPTVTIDVSNTTICEGGTSTLTANVSGGTGTNAFQWQINNSGTWEDISGANSAVYVTPTHSAGTYEYRVEISQDAGCAATSSDVLITVVTNPTIDATADNSEVCEGGTATISATVSGGTGSGNSYQWLYNDPVDGWEIIPGATSSDYTTPALTVGLHQYRVALSQDGGCIDTSATVAVNVIPAPVVSVNVDDETVCEGATASFTSTVSGGTGSTTYQWQLFDQFDGWEDIPGATSDSYVTAPLAVGTFQYRLYVSQGEGCDVFTAPLLVTVVLDPTVDVSASDDQICEGGTATLTATVTGGAGSTSYQWQLKDNFDVWQDISGATGAVYMTSSLAADIYEYRVEITQDNGCFQTSVATTITVVADPVVTIAASEEDICDGGSVQLTSTVTGGSGTSTYQWQYDDGGGWSDISGATSATYNTPVLDAGTHNYRLNVTQDAGCDVTSDLVTINVADDPTVTISANDIDICAGGAATLTASVSGGTGTASYQWQINNSGWVDIAGATGVSYTTSSLSIGTYEYRVEVIQGTGCDAVSDPLTITVVADPEVTVTADDQEICAGGTAMFSASVSGGSGSPSYQWQFNNSGTWEDVSGATSSSYSIAILTPGIYYYRVLMTQDAGCSDVSLPVAVEVVPDPDVVVTATEDEICAGGSAVLTANVTGGAGASSYQWQINNSGTWEDIGGATSDTYSSALLNPGTYEFRVQVNQDEGCFATSSAYVIVVETDPTASISVDDTEICAGGSVTFSSTVTGGTGTTNYQWQFNNSGTWEDISGANSDTYTATLVTDGTFSYRLTITQAAGCEATSAPLDITVVPGPVASISTTQTDICDGGIVTLDANVTGGSGNTDYQWQFNAPGFGWTDIAGATSDSYTTSTLSTGSYTYRVQVSQDAGCSSTSPPVTISVFDDPTVSVTSSSSTLCIGGTATFNATVNGGVGTTSFQWQYNDPTNGWEDIPGETTSSYTTPVLTTAEIFSYRVIVNQNIGCSVTSAPSFVTVVEDPTVSITVDDNTICNGGTVAFTSTLTGGTGTTTYLWQVDDGVSGWENVPGGTTNALVTDPLTTGIYDYRLIVTQETGCDDTSNVVSVTVVDDPTVTITIDDDQICEGGAANLTANVTGGAGTNAYQWLYNDPTEGWINIAGANCLNIYDNRPHGRHSFISC